MIDGRKSQEVLVSWKNTPVFFTPGVTDRNHRPVPDAPSLLRVKSSLLPLLYCERTTPRASYTRWK
jgi:hypothetical protein